MDETLERTQLGRILRASTGDFTVGCRTSEASVPRFGALVRAEAPNRGAIYGLIYDVRVDDDPFVRQLLAAGDLTPEYVEDQRARRQVPVEVNVVVVGGQDAAGRIFRYLPPQPPATLSWVTLAAPDEVRAFGERLDFLSTLLNALNAPGDELAPAALRQMAAAQGDADTAQRYLVAAGRELARLLSRDPARLNAILQRLR